MGPPPGAPPGAPPPYGAPPGAPYAAPPGAPPGAPKQFDPRIIAYVLGGCAVAILIGVFTKSWMSGRGGLGGLGPLGVEICYGSVCQSVGWPSGVSGDIQLFGYLALFGGIAAAGASGYLAFLCLTSTPAKFPAFKIVNGAIGIAAVATTFFAVRLLIESNKEFSISWSPVFAIGGVITAGIFIRKLKPYWPGQGTMPWPVIAKPQGQFGGQPGYPMQPPSGPPMGSPYGAPPSGPPMGAAPMGPPPMGTPYGAPPMGAAPIGPPPMSAGQPYGAPQGQPYGQPYAAPPYGAPAAPMSFPVTAPSAAAPQNKATIMGAPAPQLAAILQQQPPGATPVAAGASQFCPLCGKPMTFVAQYQRWFCQGCQQYA